MLVFVVVVGVAFVVVVVVAWLVDLKKIEVESHFSAFTLAFCALSVIKAHRPDLG